ncbi:MAG: ComEC/Rec2 family competence protein [Pseudomonadales bacterium]|nr:ComEC/Rec2 family competence protein [Pseudomonadales bacterium]
MQYIYVRHRYPDTIKVRFFMVVVNVPQTCQFQYSLYQFILPDCKSLKPGDVLQISGVSHPEFSREGIWSDTGFFQKKGLILKSIRKFQLNANSLVLWLVHLCELFTEKKLSVLNEFLSLFRYDEAYLTGKLAFGFSQDRSRVVDHLLKITGTQYLVSISGYHLSIFINLLLSSIRKFYGRKSMGIISFVVSSVYILAVGIKIPLVRAYLMLIISTVSSNFILRQNRSKYFIIVVAIMFILFDVSIINNSSFQLSFIATLSIILFSEKFKSNDLAKLYISESLNFQKSIKFGKSNNFFTLISNYVINSVRISIYVQILLLPLLIYHFKELSLITIIASAALTWLLPGIIVLSYSSLFFFLLDVNRLFSRLIILPLSFTSQLFLSILRFFDYEKLIIKIDYFPWWYVCICWLFAMLFFKFFHPKLDKISLLDSL